MKICKILKLYWILDSMYKNITSWIKFIKSNSIKTPPRYFSIMTNLKVNM